MWVNNIDLEELKDLARKATGCGYGEPWVAVDYGDEGTPEWYLNTNIADADYASDTDGSVMANHWDAARAERDLKYIAAVSPCVVIELIEEIERLKDLEKERSNMIVDNVPVA